MNEDTVEYWANIMGYDTPYRELEVITHTILCNEEKETFLIQELDGGAVSTFIYRDKLYELYVLITETEYYFHLEHEGEACQIGFKRNASLWTIFSHLCTMMDDL